MRDRERGKQALKGVLKFLVLPILLIIFLNWKWGLGVLSFLIISKVVKIWKRKYFAKDIHGEKLGYKEFMKRWKLGIEGITPLQQAKTNLLGNWIVLSGIVSGMIINALIRMKEQWWWIEIILGGSLILTSMSMVSGFQRYWKFKETDKIQKQFEEDLKKDQEKAEKEKEKEESEEDKLEIKFEELS